jgi:tetratricopeptide (TPR) repeat protein
MLAKDHPHQRPRVPGYSVDAPWESPQMKQLALALMLWCVVAAHAWADAKRDCHQIADLDRQLKGCTQYIEENQGNRRDLAIAHGFRSSVYLHKGDKDLAIADMTRAIELDPQNASRYGIRGLVYLGKGEHHRAIADFTKAIELQPSAPGRLLAGHYRMRGIAYQRTHNADLAIADFRRALAIDPDHQRTKDRLRRLGAAP